MRFIEKTDCKESVSNGSVNAFSTYKIKSVFLITLGFAADSSCCSMVSNLLYTVWWQTSNESWNIFRLCTGRTL